MRKKGLIAGLVLLIGAGIVVWWLLLPKTASDYFKQARTADTELWPRIAGSRHLLTGSTQAHSAAAELMSRYSEVVTRFPDSPEADDSRFRIYEIQDEVTSSGETRVELITDFLDKQTSTPHQADLRWKRAELYHKDLKKPLDAIREYEQFARDFPRDERAPEAIFRLAGIYEQIREYPRAVEAYRRVVADYPGSKFAEESQFKVGNILAEKLEKKEEAVRELEEVEKKFPKGRYAGAASGQRKKIAAAAEKSKAQKYEDDYYGGVSEVNALERAVDSLDDPYIQRIRAQGADLVHHDASVNISPDTHELTVTTELQFIPDAKLDSFVIQLGAPLKIGSIRSGDRDITHERHGNYVTMETADLPWEPHTTQTVKLQYHGTNQDHWSGDIITTASTYLTARNWLPILNYGDAATARITVSVPSGYSALTQGVQVTSSTEEGVTQVTFDQDVPVFYYVLVAAPYKSRLAKWASSGQESIELGANVFTETSDSTMDEYLKQFPTILEFYTNLLGHYPYPKLHIAQVNHFPGGLGSPGLILIGPPGFEKPEAPATFLAHEVAHMWFGNELGIELTSSSIPWLSEGFANYMDALYHEHTHGKTAFVQHMRTYAENYYTAVSSVEDRPIMETRFGDPMYSSLSYDKGAFVLHALRGVMGDDSFFRMLRNYVDECRGTIVTVDRFVMFAEKHAGEELEWFFRQWLFETGFPRYRINVARESKTASGTSAVYYEIEQLNRNFRMPVELELRTSAEPIRKKIMISETLTTGTIESQSQAEKLVVDPDYWILKHPRMEELEKAVTPD